MSENLYDRSGIDIVSIQIEPNSVLPGEVGRDFSALPPDRDSVLGYVTGRFGYVSKGNRRGYLYIVARGKDSEGAILAITEGALEEELTPALENIQKSKDFIAERISPHIDRLSQGETVALNLP